MASLTALQILAGPLVGFALSRIWEILLLVFLALLAPQLVALVAPATGLNAYSEAISRARELLQQAQGLPADLRVSVIIHPYVSVLDQAVQKADELFVAVCVAGSSSPSRVAWSWNQKNIMKSKAELQDGHKGLHRALGVAGNVTTVDIGHKTQRGQQDLREWSQDVNSQLSFLPIACKAVSQVRNDQLALGTSIAEIRKNLPLEMKAAVTSGFKDAVLLMSTEHPAVMQTLMSASHNSSQPLEVQRLLPVSDFYHRVPVETAAHISPDQSSKTPSAYDVSILVSSSNCTPTHGETAVTIVNAVFENDHHAIRKAMVTVQNAQRKTQRYSLTSSGRSLPEILLLVLDGIDRSLTYSDLRLAIKKIMPQILEHIPRSFDQAVTRIAIDGKSLQTVGDPGRTNLTGRHRLSIQVDEDSEDGLTFPSVSKMLQRCGTKLSLVAETELQHLGNIAGWVSRTRHGLQCLVRKDLVSSRQLESFEHEIRSLQYLNAIGGFSVVRLHGLVVDAGYSIVKGILVEEVVPMGSVISQSNFVASWQVRSRLARQLIALVELAHSNDICIGELNYAQFGLDSDKNLKLAGVKKRGCPIGWETPDLISRSTLEPRDSEGIFGPATMYWGCKEEIYQLGILLLALAEGRLPEFADERRFSDSPQWYKALIAMCQKEQRASRPDAGTLLKLFDEFSREDALKVSPFIARACSHCIESI